MTAIGRPYRRTIRPKANNEFGFADATQLGYAADRRFADGAGKFIRAFQLIQNDCVTLFEYIEPDDTNKKCFSFRVHAMLMRLCIECEANFKAILFENGYQNKKQNEWNIKDYKQLERSHRLSEYTARIPNWSGHRKERRPFAPWESGGSLDWYTSYNESKHDRVGKFHEATFERMTEALCGLAITISSQFGNLDFKPHLSQGSAMLLTEVAEPDFVPTIDNHLEICYPRTWRLDERYDFETEKILGDGKPFLTHY